MTNFDLSNCLEILFLIHLDGKRHYLAQFAMFVMVHMILRVTMKPDIL